MNVAAESIVWLILLTLWGAGWLVLGRVRRCTLGDAGQASPAAALSIIIPARNEENNLPVLLRSLAAQTIRPAEIIVVDDASTDRTADVARAFGARVIPSQLLPAGWRGKTWACQQGAQAATGEWLLFLDADTWFEADGLRRVLAEFEAAGGGVLSVAPHHKVRDFHEQFSAFFNLVMLAGTGAFTLRGDRLAPRGLLGQFMLIERTAYQRVGGHAAVKGRILENFWLAEQLRAAGLPLRCRGGRGVFAFRMYPQGWRDVVDGWTKGFASGAGQTPLPILLLIIAWMIGLMTAPLGLAFTTKPLLWLAAYGLCAAQVSWLLRCVGRFHWGTALFYPVPLIFYFVVFARSLRRSRAAGTPLLGKEGTSVLIELSIAWVIALNFLAWLAIQMGFAWAFTKMPVTWFNPRQVSAWEQSGRFYERVFRIKDWKGRLPDAGRWFRGGFKKSKLAGAEPEYLHRFIRETWRGELCHWFAIACAPLFFLWNPWWGDLIIASYALAANLPCILTQRYNRSRFQRMRRDSFERDSKRSLLTVTD